MGLKAVPDKLLTVTVHGASIATLLYTVITGGAPCDGLIFGETVTSTTQYLRDDDDVATITEFRATVASTLCCASIGSFYDGAGDLSESRLRELTSQQPASLLGWLSYRPTSTRASTSSAGSAAGSLQPSMRESAVTSALLRRQLGHHDSRQAVLLLLVTSGWDHNKATITWQFRCFQARLVLSTGEMLLEPLELTITNLGGRTGIADYLQLATASATAIGASGTPHLTHNVPVAGESGARASDGGVASCSIDASALAALLAGAGHQVAAVKQHFEALLGRLQQLCDLATEGEAAVEALRRRRDALLAQMA